METMTIETIYLTLLTIHRMLWLAIKAYIAACVVLVTVFLCWGLYEKNQRKKKGQGMMDKIADSITQIDLSDIKLPVIAVYEHPADYPEHYVARVFDMDKTTDTIILKDTLSALMEDIRNNTYLVFTPRGAEDVKCLVGAWL